MKALKFLPIAMAAALLSTPGAFAGNDDGADWTGELKDAWVDGKLESTYLLNSELSPFDIQTDVTDGEVMLTGKVGSTIHWFLAEQIARTVDGVTAVDNQLTVVEQGQNDAEAEIAVGAFAQAVGDATLAAAVKSRLMLEGEVAGTAIDVNSNAGEITLTGAVESETERKLAEAIARNTTGVEQVINEIRVSS